MREMSLADLQKLALRTGGKLHDGDRAFNTGKAKAASSKPRAPMPTSAPAVAAPAPVAPLPDIDKIVQEKVDAALEQTLEQTLGPRDSTHAEQMRALRDMVTEGLVALQPEPPAPPEEKPVSWSFAPQYGQGGELRGVTAQPQFAPGSTAKGKPWNFAVRYNEDGTIKSMSAKR